VGDDAGAVAAERGAPQPVLMREGLVTGLPIASSCRLLDRGRWQHGASQHVRDETSRTSSSGAGYQ